MNITREQLLDFLKSEGVQAAYTFDEDYTIAVDAFFERVSQEKQMAYLVTTGDYSDYRVVSVCSDKSLAEKFAAYNGINRIIEEVELDKYREDISAGRQLFNIKMDRNGNVVSIKIEDYGFSNPDITNGWLDNEHTHKWGIIGSFFGKDEQHAIKVANEFRIRMVAENQL